MEFQNKEPRAERLKGSNFSLMKALLEAERIKNELLNRGDAFLRGVLSGVKDFPIEKLEKCTVSIDLNEESGIVISVPMYQVGASKSITDSHKAKLALKERFSNLPEVARVDIEGSMNSGIVFLHVILESDRELEKNLSRAVEEVQGDTSKKSLEEMEK